MFEKEIQEMIVAAKLARDEILKIYQKDFDVEIKSDDSPVTEADKNADIIIKKYLSDKFPTYAFLTEESLDDGSRLENDFVFIVDPVDGTKDFVAKNGEFTTNIALAYKHEVVAGVVSIPAIDLIYFAHKGAGAFKLENGKTTEIHVNNKEKDLTVLTSNFHCTKKEMELIEKHSNFIKHVKKCGSSIKACRIAEGSAEISYRLSDGTKEWDTAAFDIIVKEAGGVVLKPDFTNITYNREDVYNRGGYIIANKKENIRL